METGSDRVQTPGAAPTEYHGGRLESYYSNPVLPWLHLDAQVRDKTIGMMIEVGVGGGGGVRTESKGGGGG